MLASASLMTSRFALFFFGVSALVGLAADTLDSSANFVGQADTNHYITPVNQILTPAGQQVALPGFRPQAIALSPDGRLLATSGKTNRLVLVNPASGKILQMVALPTDKATEPPPE